MSIRTQSLLLVLLILISLALTRVEVNTSKTLGVPAPENSSVAAVSADVSIAANLSYEKGDEAKNMPTKEKNRPVRKWDVLDPSIRAQSVLIQSLGSNFPFLHYNTHRSWPIASLTKLFTAVVVLDDIGENKKIPISEEAVSMEGTAGLLRSGEVYSARDLLKIMLLASSNDAAAAFEEYAGGRSEFVRLLNKKVRDLGLRETVLHDASGLSDLNTSTASDLLILAEYIAENRPEIFNWTRLTQFLVQPINDPTTKILYNINPFIENKNFLGGKTGTLEEAKENLFALFSMGEYRLMVVLLGSPDRISELPVLLKWVEGAYEF